jgi:hypothetical protein
MITFVIHNCICSGSSMLVAVVVPCDLSQYVALDVFGMVLHGLWHPVIDRVCVCVCMATQECVS